MSWHSAEYFKILLLWSLYTIIMLWCGKFTSIKWNLDFLHEICLLIRKYFNFSYEILSFHVYINYFSNFEVVTVVYDSSINPLSYNYVSLMLKAHQNLEINLYKEKRMLFFFFSFFHIVFLKSKESKIFIKWFLGQILAA